MKSFFKIVILTILLSIISGCVTYEPISQPETGSDKHKIARFQYMQSNWSYLYSRWIKGQEVKPEDIVVGYGISYDQAKSEVNEFVESQYNYNFIHCLLLSGYLDNIRFYVK